MKLKANELRLGNFVYDDEGIVVKVECLRSKEFNDWNGCEDYEIMFSKQGDLCWSGDCFGIPLTEEILVKCDRFYQLPHFTIGDNWIFDFGIGQHLSISCVNTPNLMVSICCIDGEKITDVCPVWNWDVRGQIYLHNFQNIIFDLTGEELNIKL